jgi:hypothetical protein
MHDNPSDDDGDDDGDGDSVTANVVNVRWVGRHIVVDPYGSVVTQVHVLMELLRNGTIDLLMVRGGMTNPAAAAAVTVPLLIPIPIPIVVLPRNALAAAAILSSRSSEEAIPYHSLFPSKIKNNAINPVL